MFFLLGILTMIIAGLLIFVVVIQNSKGGGLTSTFGGASSASQLLGSRRSTEIIEKVTWYLFAGMAILAFFANVVGTNLANAGNAGLEMQQTLDANSAYQQTGASELPTFSNPPAEDGSGGGASPAPATGNEGTPEN